MYNKKLNLLPAAAFGAAAVTFAIAGCGGGGSNSATTAPQSSDGLATNDNANIPAGRGRFAVTVRWPELPAETGSEPSRYIPLATQTLYFELTELATGQKYPFVAARRGAAGQGVETTAFEQFLPVGEYVLACVARPDGLRQQPTGINLAVGAVRLTINEGQTTRIPITLETTVATIVGSAAGVGSPDNPLRVNQKSTPVSFEARAADGSLIPYSLLAGDANLIRYEATGGADKIRLDAQGNVTGVAPGLANIRISVVGKPDLFADVPFAVIGDTTLSDLSIPTRFVGQTLDRLVVTQNGTASDTGTPAAYAWESLTPAVGTVTPDGVLTGITAGLGRVRVTTTGGQIPGGIRLSSEYPFVVEGVESFAVNNPPASLNAGQSVTLRALARIILQNGGARNQDQPVRWEVVTGAEYAEINAETGELRGKPSNNGQQTARVRATFVPTGAVAEANILINTYGGVNVGVD